MSRYITRLFISIFIVLIGISPFAFIANGQEDKPTPFSEMAFQSEGLSLDDAAKLQGALEEMICKRQDIDDNIGHRDSEKKLIIEEGYIIIEGENGLPKEIIQPDGTVIDFFYETNSDGKIVFVELWTKDVTLTVSYNNTMSGSDGQNSDPAINTAPPGASPSNDASITPPQQDSFSRTDMLNYGRLNFRAIRNAFEELGNKKAVLKKKYKAKTKPTTKYKLESTESDIQGTQEYKREMNSALNKFYKTISDALRKTGFSSVEIKNDGLDVVIILPVKKK